MGAAIDTFPNSVSPPRRRRRRWLGRLFFAILLLFVIAELVARFYLGLGDPPLSVADADVEYLFKPSQDVRRFGNRIYYNAYSMRADEFPKDKSHPNELRVIVIGDSIVNGGSQTDQAQLATSILQQRLRERLGRPVVGGNVSAGSWGPVNMLAYARKFGLFDADVVVIVLSSHDYGDAPTEPFTPVVGVQPEYPDRRPVLALGELLSRYLLPRLRAGVSDASVPTDRPPEQSEVERSLRALADLVGLAKSSGARVIVAQYPEQRELREGPLPGHGLIEATARQAGAEVVQLTPAFRDAVARGEQPYRDPLHPNATGQKLIADALLDLLIASPATGPATAKAPAEAIGH